MTTTAELEDIFIGPPVPSSQDWLLPTYLQPGYGSEFIEGGFPERTYTPTWIDPQPQTSWLSSFSKPFVDFGKSLYEGSQKRVEATYEQLPELLWGWGMEKVGIIDRPIDRPKQITVDEGAGVFVSREQPAHPGGVPAQPITTFIPQLIPVPGAAVGSQAQAIDKNVLLIGAGLIGLLLLIGRK